ncbi:sulfuric ester hydrolase [Aureococcus anophagefferens]|nr:sulfuric ester hydrolase [Aureococcus anophagefferens]
MQPAGYGGLDHERTPLQRPRFSRQAVLAAPLFAAVAGLVILVVLELAPESALHRASLASALQAPITADHHHRNITSAAPHIVLAVLDDAGWDDWLRRPTWRARTAGYRTALVGKWHLGHYNESLTPARRGFGESYGFWAAVDHFTPRRRGAARASETPATDGTCALDWQVNGLPRPRATGVYAAYACRDAARRLVASHEGKEEPLFLYYALPTPHEPITPPDDVETYDLLPKLDVAGRRRDYAAVNVRGSSHEGLVHVADWAPTLLNAAGLRPDLVAGFDAMDGVDQWDALAASARRRATRSSWASTTRRRAAAPRARSGGGSGSCSSTCAASPSTTGVRRPGSGTWTTSAELPRRRGRPGRERTYDAEPDIAAALEKRLVELHVAAEAPRARRAPSSTARAWATRRPALAPLVRTGDRSHCDDARRDADAIRADSCARLAPAACDGASARSAYMTLQTTEAPCAAAI